MVKGPLYPRSGSPDVWLVDLRQINARHVRATRSDSSNGGAGYCG